MSQSPAEKPREQEGVPEGLWMRCPECSAMLFPKAVKEALHVCPECQYHFKVPARERIEQLVDPGSFEEKFADIAPTDPLGFVDKKSYADRLAEYQEKTGNLDAVVCGKGFIKGRPDHAGRHGPRVHGRLDGLASSARRSPAPSRRPPRKSCRC